MINNSQTEAIGGDTNGCYDTFNQFNQYESESVVHK